MVQNNHKILWKTIYSKVWDQIKIAVKSEQLTLIKCNEKNFSSDLINLISNLDHFKIIDFRKTNWSDFLAMMELEMNSADTKLLYKAESHVWIYPPSIEDVQNLMKKLILPPKRGKLKLVIIFSSNSQLVSYELLEKSISFEIPNLENDGRSNSLYKYVEFYTKTKTKQEKCWLKAFENIRKSMTVKDVEDIIQLLIEITNLCFDKFCQNCNGLSEDTVLKLTDVIENRRNENYALELFFTQLNKIIQNLRYFHKKEELYLAPLQDIVITVGNNKLYGDTLYTLILSKEHLNLYLIDEENLEVIINPLILESSFNFEKYYSYLQLRNLLLSKKKEIIDSLFRNRIPTDLLSKLDIDENSYKKLLHLIHRYEFGPLKQQFTNIYLLKSTLADIKNLDPLVNMKLSNSLDLLENRFSYENLDFEKNTLRDVVEFSNLITSIDLQLIKAYNYSLAQVYETKFAMNVLSEILQNEARNIMIRIENAIRNPDESISKRDLESNIAKLNGYIRLFDQLRILSEFKDANPISRIYDLIEKYVIEKGIYDLKFLDKLNAPFLQTAIYIKNIKLCRKISECFTFTRNYKELEKQIQLLRERMQQYLKVPVISELQDIIEDHTRINNALNFEVLTDVKELEDLRDSLFEALVEFYQKTILDQSKFFPGSLTISDLVYYAFQPGNQKIAVIKEYKEFLGNEEFHDVVLFIIDALPYKPVNDFLEDYETSLNQRQIFLAPGFSVFPTVTAPGHVSIITGRPPWKTGIFHKEIVLKDLQTIDVFGTKKREDNKRTISLLKPLIRFTIPSRIEETLGISSFLFTKYRFSPFSGFLLGSFNEDNPNYKKCGRGLLFDELKMIPIITGHDGRDIKRSFYIIQDNEVDRVQHDDYLPFNDKMEFVKRNLEEVYPKYLKELFSAIKIILEKAKSQNRRILIIVTSDHGVGYLEKKNQDFFKFLDDSGLMLIHRRKFFNVNGEKFYLQPGLYSRFFKEIFDRYSSYTHYVKRNRWSINQGRIGILSHNYGSAPYLMMYLSENVQNEISMFSIQCLNCGYKNNVIMHNWMVNLKKCPRCDQTAELKFFSSFSSIINKNLKKYTKIRTLNFPFDPNIPGLKPYITIIPPPNEFFMRYPGIPREIVIHILRESNGQIKKDKLIETYGDYSNLVNPNEIKEECLETIEDLKNLGYLEEEKREIIKLLRDTDYTGVCTILTHGAISMNEIIVPIILIKGEN